MKTRFLKKFFFLVARPLPPFSAASLKLKNVFFFSPNYCDITIFFFFITILYNNHGTTIGGPLILVLVVQGRAATRDLSTHGSHARHLTGAVRVVYYFVSNSHIENIMKVSQYKGHLVCVFFFSSALFSIYFVKTG